MNEGCWVGVCAQLGETDRMGDPSASQRERERDRQTRDLRDLRCLVGKVVNVGKESRQIPIRLA